MIVATIKSILFLTTVVIACYLIGYMDNYTEGQSNSVIFVIGITKYSIIITLIKMVEVIYGFYKRR